MKIGKLAVAALVVAVFMFLTDWLWFGMIMKDKMPPLPNARPEMDYVHLSVGILIFAVAFVYIFSQGRGSGSPLGEGSRFGIWATFLVFVPMGFIMYSLTTTMSISDYLTNDVFRLVQLMIMGVIAAYMTGMGGARGKGATGGDD